MPTSCRPRPIVAAVLLVLAPIHAAARSVTIPPGTAVFVETDERVTSRIKKDGTDIGDVVNAHVWRDVSVDGAVVIKAGTPILVRVSEVKKAKVAGIKGKLELEAVSVPAVDGTQILLDGGYDKSGRSRMGLSISLAAVVALPLIFIHGKPAILESGTVFDADVENQTVIQVDSGTTPSRTVRLGGGATLEVNVLYDEMDSEGKDRVLPLNLKACDQALTSARVVTVNGEAIEPVAVVMGASTKDGDCTTVRGTVDLKALGKHFRKGINRFEVEAADRRVEIVLDVEL